MHRKTQSFSIVPGHWAENAPLNATRLRVSDLRIMLQRGRRPQCFFTSGDKESATSHKKRTRGSAVTEERPPFQYRSILPPNAPPYWESTAAWCPCAGSATEKVSAFVITPGADKYYCVQVGPYADTQSAANARQDLEANGFQSIVKR